MFSAFVSDGWHIIVVVLLPSFDNIWEVKIHFQADPIFDQGNPSSITDFPSNSRQTTTVMSGAIMSRAGKINRSAGISGVLMDMHNHR